QDPQHHVMFDQWMADVHFLVGDFERSYEYAMKARYIYGALFHLETALWSAIFLGDADRIRTAAQALQSVESAGRITRTMKLAAAAAVAQGEAKTTEATHLARQYPDEIPKIRTARDHAISRAVSPRLLGTDPPPGAEAAREAHRIRAEQGRTRLLEALADGLVASPTEAERLA